MKATIEFDLPEDQDEYMICSNATNYYSALDDIFSVLRQRIKYDCEKYSDTEIELMEELRDRFVEIRKEYGVEE
jgi:hypothetical protein